MNPQSPQSSSGTGSAPGAERIKSVLKALQKVKRIQSFARVTLIEALHLFFRPILKQLGFVWEVRRRGELQLGFWRKSFTQRSSRNSSLDASSRANTRPRRLVLVPGLGDSPLAWAQVWGPLQLLLKNHYDELVLIDFPGFNGFQSTQQAFHSMDRLIELFEDLMDSFEPDVLIGHSLGGWLAAHYAKECGKKNRPQVQNAASETYSGPQHLILVAPAGVFPDQKAAEDFQQSFHAAVKGDFSSYRPKIFAREPIWFRFVAREVEKFFGKEEMSQFINSISEAHILTNELSFIQSRTTLIWGEEDTLIPPAWAKTWKKQISSNPSSQEESDVQVFWIKGAGHSPHAEKPLATAGVLGEVLKGYRKPKVFDRLWQEQT